MPVQDMNLPAQTLTGKNYMFSSEDGQWRVNLTEGDIQTCFFSRVGLRYVDVFCRSAVGLKECQWSELIQPYFLGLMSSGISDHVKGMASAYEIITEDGNAIIRINSNLVLSLEAQEECFQLDSDIYTEKKVPCDSIKEKLEYLHDRSSRLIRYAITDKLHEAMEPEEI